MKEEQYKDLHQILRTIRVKQVSDFSCISGPITHNWLINDQNYALYGLLESLGIFNVFLQVSQLILIKNGKFLFDSGIKYKISFLSRVWLDICG